MIKLLLIALSGFLVMSCGPEPGLVLRDPVCEYLTSPRGLDVATPRFSWKFNAANPEEYGMAQAAYHLQVSSSPDFSEKQLFWDSGWVESSAMTNIVYAGAALQTDRDYFWRVKVKDRNLVETSWSEVQEFSTGLFQTSDWHARWIGQAEAFVPGDEECKFQDPWFRKTFSLTTRPERAVLYLASVGYHELYVNGTKVTDDVLAPAVSDHSVRARYIAYPIGEYLQKGENVIAVWLGTSWSIFEPYWIGDKPLTPIFIAQADIYCSKKAVQTGIPDEILQSDSTWMTHPSPNRLLGNWAMRNMGGEIWDARLENKDWNKASCDLTDWVPATEYSANLKLSAQKVYPNRKFEEIRPVAVERLENGDYRVDMGVNYAGWTEIKVQGTPGERIDFFFSEREQLEMTFNNHNAYIPDASGKGTFRNRFNYSSGRWITVKGLTTPLEKEDVRGWTLRTAYPVVSSFSCSDSLQNWINDRVLWTFRNLSLGGYVVDCPQRERLGYGGDAHATSETAMFNYDMAAFYTKWMEDWRDAQGRESNIGPVVGGGVLPHTAPTNNGGGGPAWGGIVVMLPWKIYQQYGDVRILEENYALICNWLDFLWSKTDSGLLRRFGGPWDFLADWLWPGATAEGMNNDKPAAVCFNSAYFALNLSTAAQIAQVLGRDGEAHMWTRKATEVREAVHAAFYDEDDRSYCDRTMGNLAMTLLAEVPPAALRPLVLERLEKEIRDNCDGHIDVGITGGAVLFMLLREEGRDDLIYEMTSKTDYPGWGFMKENGATTIWEMWEKDLPGHSLLHSSFLFPGAWYLSGVAGIQPDPAGPGFRQFVLKVPVLNGMQQASGAYDSISGEIVSRWKVNEGLLDYEVVVPPNTRATVLIPKKDGVEIHEDSGHVRFLGIQKDSHAFMVSSGHYHFYEVRE